jgi:hypothetical protein
MNLSDLKPKAGTGIVRNRRVREPQENPFLDEDMEGNLKQSYELGQDYEITVSGWWEVDTIKRGESAGQEIDRLRGDAAEVVSFLRRAANELGIGVTIQTVDASPDDVKEGDELVTVKYMGVERRQYTKSEPDPDAENGQ